MIYSLIGIIFFFVNCKPIAGNWDFTIGARCASIQTIKAFGLLNTSESLHYLLFRSAQVVSSHFGNGRLLQVSHDMKELGRGKS